MSDLAELAHTLSVAWTRAALCRDMGERGMAEYWDDRAAEAEREIALLDVQPVPDRGEPVRECGVS